MGRERGEAEERREKGALTRIMVCTGISFSFLFHLIVSLISLMISKYFCFVIKCYCVFWYFKNNYNLVFRGNIFQQDEQMVVIGKSYVQLSVVVLSAAKL